MGARLGWGWVERCRALGGEPTLEMFEEAVAAGRDALPLMVDVLSRRSFRLGEPDDCGDLPVHALRVVGEIGDPAALPAVIGVLADPVDPTKYGDEAAVTASRLGPVALPSVERLLADRAQDVWVRTCAAHALVLASLRDGATRPRVLRALEAILRDPLERDRELVAHVVLMAVRAGATELLEAMGSAFDGERVDRDVVDERGVQKAFTRTDGGPDPLDVELASRDPRGFYRPWSFFEGGLDPELASSIGARLAAPDPPDARPPAEV